MDKNAVLEILRQFKIVLEEINIKVEKLILFGSYAVGTAKEDSDIDVVVVSQSFADKDYWERIDILTEAIYKIFAPIEASAFTPEEWNAEKSLLTDYAKNCILI